MYLDMYLIHDACIPDVNKSKHHFLLLLNTGSYVVLTRRLCVHTYLFGKPQLPQLIYESLYSIQGSRQLKYGMYVHMCVIITLEILLG